MSSVPVAQRSTKGLAARQASLPGLCPVAQAVEILATDAGIEARGAIFTRREIVEFLLDLCGYQADRPLHKLRLLEPSFGGGDFLLPAIERLLAAWKTSDDPRMPVKALAGCVRAVELHRETFTQTHGQVIDLLSRNGLTASQSIALADAWLINDDFLLADLPDAFDVVIGNPPYVRQERVPDVLLAEYRSRYTTIYDRADLYIPFIERSLRSLTDGGVLGFICADRWMKNRYGGPLRNLVSEQFHLKVYVDMVDTPAFHSDVIAYPAITVIARERGKSTRISHRPSIESKALRALALDLTSSRRPAKDSTVQTIDGVASGSEPWILDSSDQLAVIRRLEAAFPLLEETGCKVGIGVATGADKAFIGPMDELTVEDDRKLPLVMTKDIADGTVKWRGLGVVNPFADEGGLVDLARYPMLKRFLEARKEQIAGRHCAQKVPANWYRTIDRITPSIAKMPKLLIPDIKGQAHIVFEEGKLYPHHNLYYITSNQWDLKALQAVLLSSVTRLFIATYSTKMHGGFLRFQAQYLRRLRLPRWSDVPQNIKSELINAAETRDLAACNAATFQLYGLSRHEKAALGGNGD
ncbi:MAG: Eco57I restriction-modification methylase domain-containing protein [Alphaproteobacteria bacterium]|nr:Eco57I restriction-modification methylase domain-containing protein [Alphaproteobacteria bacterium]